MARDRTNRKYASEQYGVDWDLDHCPGTPNRWLPDRITLILLQEIRDELKTLNALLGCRNFTDIPATLRTIAEQTARPRRPKKKKEPR